jgi:hypothetical protein
MASRPPTQPSNRPPRPPRPPGGGIPGAGGGSNNNQPPGNSTPPPSSTPPTPTPEPTYASFITRSGLSAQVKPATPDIIIFDDSTDIDRVEELTDLFFQEIGGRELINLTNKDIINSINPGVGPIANMFKINLQYNAQNLVPLFDPGNEIFNRFSIKLNDYVPEEGEGTGPGKSTIYIDDNGDLVINLVNFVNNEKIEVQILNGGSVFNDTIYTEETT